MMYINRDLMKKVIAFSSEEYLIAANSLKRLELADNYYDSANVVVLLGDVEKGIADKLLSGGKYLEDNKYIKTKIAYYSYPAYASFFLNFIKSWKRKNYIQGSNAYFTLLEDILSKDITRGERTAENAYAWSNKKWFIPENERKEKYQKLYDSFKKNGYDIRHPMLILLNRKLGVKDQLLQGHHRISVCRELGVNEVAVRFWASQKSPSFMSLIYKIFSIFNKRAKI